MSMEGPGSTPQEKGVESIPTREEILLEIGKHCENPAVKRELSDEKGVYLLEVQGESKEEGETIEYIYQRKGVFPDNNASLETLIHVVYSDKDGIPTGGHDIVQYNAQTKKWE